LLLACAAWNVLLHHCSALLWGNYSWMQPRMGAVFNKDTLRCSCAYGKSSS